MSVVETTADERRILRRAGFLRVGDQGLVYVDAPGRSSRTPRGVVDSLEAKGLIVLVNGRFERTAAGDAVLGIGGGS